MYCHVTWVVHAWMVSQRLDWVSVQSQQWSVVRLRPYCTAKLAVEYSSI